jgi:hypothetical protein
MKSQLRFVMHPDDESSVLRELLQDSSVLFIDGARWKHSKPETSRSLSNIGNYCIVWSPEDLSELSAEYVANAKDWYCRSEDSTIQFLRSRMEDAVLTEGRFAVWTETARAAAASGVERRYKMLRRTLKKTYSNSRVQWLNPTLPIAPAGPSRSANPGKPDTSLWVGPAAMAWLLADKTRRIKQFLTGSVEGFVEAPPNMVLQRPINLPRFARAVARR